MKKTLLLSSVAVLSTVATFAQTKAPQSFNYQGALRKPDGTPLQFKTVALRLSILKDSPTGAQEYWEIRKVTSNSLGLYNIAIGSAGAITTSTQSFNNIAWGAGDKYFEVAVDLNGTSGNFISAGVSPILAVPYSLHAEKGGTSGYNTWVSRAENTGATADDYLTYLKNQAAATVTTTGKNITAASEIDGLLTIDNGTGAVLKTTTISLNKTIYDKAAQNAVVNGLVNANGTPGANGILQDAVSKANAIALNANPATATAATKDFQDAVKKSVSNVSSGAGTLKADNTGKNSTQILSIVDGNSATFHDATYTISKLALNNNTTTAINNPTAANGGTDLATALNNNTIKALRTSINSAGQQELQDALNYNLANGISNTTTNISTATTAQQALTTAIKAAIPVPIKGNISSNDNNTTATTIIKVQNGENSAFKDVVLSLNKINLQNAVAEGFANPGNTKLKTALDQANSTLISDPNSATVQAIGNAKMDTKSPLNAATNLANANALNQPSPAANSSADILQKAVQSQAKAAAKSNVSANANQNIISVEANDSSTFIPVVVNYSQANADVANAVAINAIGNPMNIAVQSQAKAAAKSNVSANANQNIISVAANDNSTFIPVVVNYSQANADVANAVAINAIGNPMNIAVQSQAKAAAKSNVSANDNQNIISVAANDNSTFIPVVVNYSQANADVANAAAINETGNPMNIAVKKLVNSAEPWQVVNSTVKASSNIESIYQNANIGLGDFSSIATTERLDIDGNARLRQLPTADVISHPYHVVATEDGTLGRIINSTGTVKFAGAETSLEITDLAQIPRHAIKDIYFYNGGAKITLPAASDDMVGVEITFFISGGAENAFIDGYNEDFSIHIPAGDPASILHNYTPSLDPYSSLLSTWNEKNLTFVNNINRVLRAYKLKMVSNGEGVYRWVFTASGV